MEHTKTPMIDVIAFDADDTLWHNERLFAKTHGKFKQLLAHYCDPQKVQEQLDETEQRNLRYFGYGIKGFTLSMVETAIELTDGRIRGREIQEIITFAKEMLTTPIQLFDHVESVLATLVESYLLMLITKGDLLDQETKLARSGLAAYFTHIEIISEKTQASYNAILTKHNIAPKRFLMVGNSLRSDILPVLEIGGHAVYIPYHLTWVHERVPMPDKKPEGYVECEHIGMLPKVVNKFLLSSSKKSGKGLDNDSF
jgi:putative hydrolase of the HAD superfamily